MRKILILIVSYTIFSACTISLDSQPAAASKEESQKLDEKTVDGECKKGSSQACELDEWIQKKKKEQNKKIIEESGVRSKR